MSSLLAVLAPVCLLQAVEYRSPAGADYRAQRDTGAIARAESALAADPRNVDKIIALGVAQFLSIGTAGGLGPDQSVGDVVVLTRAIRDEGVSYHYLAPEIDAVPDAALTAELANALGEHSSGSTWTTDAPERLATSSRNCLRLGMVSSAALSSAT